MRWLFAIFVLVAACSKPSLPDKQSYFYDGASKLNLISEPWAAELEAVIGSLDEPPLNVHTKDDEIVRCTVVPPFAKAFLVVLEKTANSRERTTVRVKRVGAREKYTSDGGHDDMRILTDSELAEGSRVLPGEGRVSFPSGCSESRSGPDGFLFLLEWKNRARYRAAFTVNSGDGVSDACVWLIKHSYMNDEWERLLAR